MWQLIWPLSQHLTLPGMKQQRPMSIYFRYDIPSSDKRVSTADRMSTCLASGWFLRSDSRRGSWHFTDFDILACSWSTLVKPLFNFRWQILLNVLHSWKHKIISFLANYWLTLFILMDYPIHIDTTSTNVSIFKAGRSDKWQTPFFTKYDIRLVPFSHFSSFFF